MKKPIVTKSGLIKIVILAAVVSIASTVLYSRSWHAYQRRWHKAASFAPKVRELLQSDPKFRSVRSRAYQLGGPAEVAVFGTLESQAQLDDLIARVDGLTPPIPIQYNVIVTDALRKGRALAASLAREGMEPTRWVITSMSNGTFAVEYRDRILTTLEPLNGKPIDALILNNTPVADLSPLEGMPLEGIVFDVHAVEHGLDTIRNMKTLRAINYLPPEEFWKQQEEQNKTLDDTSL